MTLEPFKSAMSVGAMEDTSLALPSDNNLRLGQRRVLDQVHTIKRSKSRQSRTGSMSPTSPQSDSVFTEFRSFKFSPTKTNGSFFSRNNSSIKTTRMQTTKAKQERSFTLPTGTVRRQVSSSSQLEQQFQPTYNEQSLRASDGLKPSRSDPMLNKIRSATLPARPQRASMYSIGNNYAPPMGIVNSANQVVSSSSQVVNSQSPLIRTASNQSNSEAKMTATRATKLSETAGTNGNGSVLDITIKEAVGFLSSSDENFQLRGASVIQHDTFKEEKAKQEVFQLDGIPKLVSLLQSPNPKIQQAATAALRNLVFKNNDNKQEVCRCGGIDEALTLLKDTDSAEIQRQLTGLLWNLSSAENLKPELIERALPVLTESVVVPFTCWSDASTSNNIDPEVFCSTTGCLRNLSSAKETDRNAMRNCSGLIDSLVAHIQSCVQQDKPDEMSVENSICILHNLSYQLDVGLSGAQSMSSGNSFSKRAPSLGCFSPQSSDIEDESYCQNSQKEEIDPKGCGLLYHSKTMQTYLSLLGSSQKDSILEACSGALQNLTANKAGMSNMMSQTIVQKLNGLPQIVPLLKTQNPNLQKSVMSLVGNLSRNPTLQSTIARQTLPQIANILSSPANNKTSSDDMLATSCRTFHTLLLAEPEMGKKLINSKLVDSLKDLSGNGYFPKANKAASSLLYGLWSEKEIQGFLKKQGMPKSSFVNDITNSVHKSLQLTD